ncbi:hypothetical protein LINGRAHAP2_LOCUS24687, partial [Linum grandiflorum]
LSRFLLQSPSSSHRFLILQPSSSHFLLILQPSSISSLRFWRSGQFSNLQDHQIHQSSGVFTTAPLSNGEDCNPRFICLFSLLKHLLFDHKPIQSTIEEETDLHVGFQVSISSSDFGNCCRSPAMITLSLH